MSNERETLTQTDHDATDSLPRWIDVNSKFFDAFFFDPKEDITVFELALVICAFDVSYNRRDPTGKSQTVVCLCKDEKMDPRIERHFRSVVSAPT